MSRISLASAISQPASSNRGGNANSIAAIIEQLQKAQGQANEANLARYNQGLAELNTGRDSMRQYFAQANSLIQDIGTSAVSEINRGSERAYAQGRQQLISSGLSNTTIAGSLIRGTEEDRQRELQRVDEQRRVALGGLSERQASAELGASGAITNFIAARDDRGPDIGGYAGLIQAAAAAPTGPIQARGGINQAALSRPNTTLQYPGQQRGGGGGGGGGSQGSQPRSTGGGGSTGTQTGARTVGPGAGTRYGAQRGSAYGASGQQLNPPRTPGTMAGTGAGRETRYRSYAIV